jgi:hypothetical protein
MDDPLLLWATKLLLMARENMPMLWCKKAVVQYLPAAKQ